MRIRTVYTADHPWRAETIEGGRRVTAEATLPGETLGDVLEHLGDVLMSLGAPPDAPARVVHVGCPVSQLGRAASVLLGEQAGQGAKT